MNFSEEVRLSAGELAQMIFEKEGVEIHESTVRRWALRGVMKRRKEGEAKKTVKLESRRYGRLVFTSWEAYERFSEELNGADG